MNLFSLLSPVLISYVYCSIKPTVDLSARWGLLRNVYEDFIGNEQASIAVFDIDTNKAADIRKDALHKVLNSIRPVLVYDDLNAEIAEEISDMGGDLDSPLTSKCYVAMSTSTALIEDNLKFSAKVNTNGKWIFTMIEVTSADVEALLIRAWSVYMMTNILITYSDLNSDLFVKSFNPFELNGKQHGKFYTQAVQDETLPEIRKELDNVFRRKVRNLQSYPLKATRFPEPSGQNAILDEEMQKIFKTMLNTNFTVFEANEGKFSRIKHPNGTFVGALRDIEEGKSDILLNNRILYGMNSTKCNFLKTVGATEMKYVILKFPQEKSILRFHVMQAFDWPTKFAYGVTFFSIVFAWSYLNALRAKFIRRKRSGDSLAKLFLMVVGIQSSVAIQVRRRAPTYQRILIASLLIHSLITCNSFQGAILNNLTHPKKTPNINTLNEILASDLNLTALVSIPDLFKPNEDASNVNRVQLELYHRQTVDHELSVEEVHTKGIFKLAKQAVLMRSQYATDLVNLEFDNATGESIYHIVNESPVSYYLTYIVPKSSPFIVTFNQAILSAREFGFLTLVNMKVKALLELNRLKRYMTRTESLSNQSTPAITMGNMRNIFVFYFVCISICCFVFFIEVLHKKLSTRQPPLPFIL